MRNLIIPAGAAAGLLLLNLPASADGVANRYQLEKTEKGYVRLDTQTGEMALCVEKDGKLSCRVADDERAALGDRIDALEKRVTALEQNGSGHREETTRLPDDAEIEKTLGIMEKFMRGFFDIAKELRDENKPSEATPGPQPDRT